MRLSCILEEVINVDGYSGRVQVYVDPSAYIIYKFIIGLTPDRNKFNSDSDTGIGGILYNDKIYLWDRLLADHDNIIGKALDIGVDKYGWRNHIEKLVAFYISFNTYRGKIKVNYAISDWSSRNVGSDRELPESLLNERISEAIKMAKEWLSNSNMNSYLGDW